MNKNISVAQSLKYDTVTTTKRSRQRKLIINALNHCPVALGYKQRPKLPAISSASVHCNIYHLYTQYQNDRMCNKRLSDVYYSRYIIEQSYPYLLLWMLSRRLTVLIYSGSCACFALLLLLLLLIRSWHIIAGRGVRERWNCNPLPICNS